MNLSESQQLYTSRCIDRLYEKFDVGIYDNSLFRRVIDMKIENVVRFEKFFDCKYPQIKIASIKLVAKNSEDLNFLKRFVGEEDYVVEVVLNLISERKEYVEMIASLLDEESVFLSNIIMSLKKMGKEEYLTALLFSDNNNLVKFIKRITEND